MPHPLFDRSRLHIRPLSERRHDLDITSVKALDTTLPNFSHPAIGELADRIAAAKNIGSARILMMGAHVLRAGVQRYLIDLLERGVITHIAMNGAGPIHDWEMAMIGATTESVAHYIQTGEFGLWRETGRINDVIRDGVKNNLGAGEAIGRAILNGDFPHRDISVLAAGVRLGIPITVHIGIGYDIVHEHPNCDAASWGQASYSDFLIFAEHVRNLEDGVLLNFGSAVMGPEIYLKALAMARNLARQDSKHIRRFATGVFDLLPLGDEFRTQPEKSDPRYYYRPWKTILVRTVADGGESFYVQGDHAVTLPHLHRAVMGRVEK